MSAPLMRFDPKTISIDSINLDDTTYKISTPKPIDDLIFSIRRIGLLSPPIIKQTQEKYVVVSGFRRIAATRHLGWLQIDARIISNESEENDCLRVAIADNALNRQLNLIEQSIALSKLTVFYKNEKELSLVSEALGLRLNPAFINKLIKLCTFAAELQDGIISGAIPLTIALELGNLDRPSLTSLCSVFDSLKPTLNQQKELLNMMKDISSIRNILIAELLDEKKISDILNHLDLNRHEKILQLRSVLRSMRYPVITSFYDHFNEVIYQFKLPKTIKLIPPENFEDIDFSIILRFHSLSEFEFQTEILKNLSNHPEFKVVLNKEIAN